MTDQDQGPRAPTNPQHVMLQSQVFNLLAGASQAPLPAKQHKGLEQSALILEGYLNAQFPEAKPEPEAEPQPEVMEETPEPETEQDVSEHEEQQV